MFACGGSSRVYGVAAPATSSPGAIIQTLSGPGVSPLYWRNGAAGSVLTDNGARNWTAVGGLFGFAATPAGAARYYAYISDYSDVGDDGRADQLAYVAGKMGLSI
jgi:hypothetical protein